MILEIKNKTEKKVYIDGLVQERRKSIVNALEFHLSCTNPSIYLCENHWSVNCG